ncbi:MAG: type I-F CRISPR-associated protein Csy1 [gamma proteobacterium endosymbiont of Lamellibrachia anaximandri]|nr:type I-F CRISPR-associated protein Csy1 [gamma proteobacterium endosymbiont of Lamellibrachia anaximandri]MBL3533666.1 type I-F CRISPR-associated protein Csy1 [gamma proteobacterium endosymbiont of Lamellibrachia anaximandri]
MDAPINQPDDSDCIRAVINQFLQERLKPKLDKLKEGEDEKHQKLLEAHQPEIWIADAARRVSQIQQVTHAIKYTHPDAKGTSLNSSGNPAAGEHLIGTHTLNGSAPSDVVGNAAALDVYKFLRLEVNGKTLLRLAGDSAPALVDALSADTEVAQGWMTVFANITEPKGEPTSHKLAKQLYWPLGNSEYHLLAPLFPTALVHGIYSGIREDRFSEAAKTAREARRNKQPHDHGFREYPNFAIQNFGGTKPQNISQLNSERHGENYLLAALPPSWKSERISPPLNMESVFDRWLNRNKRIYKLTTILRGFLVKVQPVNNINIRDKRAELVASIVDEIVQFAAQLRDLSPGWSQHEDCHLNTDECYWLDPYRGLDDKEFAAERSKSNWREAIYDRLGNWLNARLNTDKTPMSDAEHAEWRSVLKAELRMLREELDYHE